MQLCSDHSTQEALEDAASIVEFLREALCGAREIPFDNDTMAGAQIIFFALQADMREIRNRLITQPE